MTKLYAIIFLCVLSLHTSAQKNPETQEFGKVDIADLELKACAFEKDANAEVLFDTGNIFFGGDLSLVGNYHKRIKIFNDNGKKEADIHITYRRGSQEHIGGLQAQTINLVNGKAEIIKLDKKLVYTKVIDNYRMEMVFTFPNVKPGSIIEYKYTWSSGSSYTIPTWYFQEKIPVRYSEFTTSVPDFFNYRQYTSLLIPFTKHLTSAESRATYTMNKEVMGMANMPSLQSEVYMGSFVDNLLSITHQLISIDQGSLLGKSFLNTWVKVADLLVEDGDFGGQFKRSLKNEDAIINKAKAFKTDREKIAYIFNEVKNTMKWNGVDTWWTIDGTSKAWDAKTGNSTEVNLILYHLLKQAGVKVYPMVVSTREHGRVLPHNTSLSQFNRAVVYAPLDSAHTYILDATGKYNVYNQPPSELLNSSGLFVNKDAQPESLIFIQKNEPARQTVYIIAEIKAGGKIEGKATLVNAGYNRTNAIEKYKTDGEKKYIDYLRNDDNALKISDLKFTNLEIDTLPLIQDAAFTMDLPGSDENYIYLNPTLLSPLKKNPFLSEKRMSDIDFGFLKSYIIGGTYQIPAGYKIDAKPQNSIMTMADNSVIFKRIIGEQNGSITLRYTIEYKKSIFFKENYEDFREFFKKMYEMLNEQIILKKS